MSQKSEGPKVGRLIPQGENPGRDAIHVAVAPVFAGMLLEPGQHVCINPSDYTAWTSPPSKGVMVGIVDPYLKGPVKRGERFWLFLYPNTITSLRHVWTHPMFTIQVPKTPNEKET